MKTHIIYTILLMLGFVLSGCQPKVEEAHEEDSHSEAEATNSVHLLQEQMDVMEILTGSFQKVNLKTTVKVNGQLELPPQNKASVSTLKAGRVKNILVVEGDEVRKGQVLARLEHPSFLELQEEYLTCLSEFDFLKKEYERKKLLLADSITAVKSFELAESNYKTKQGQLNTLKAKLTLLGVDAGQVAKGNISGSIPIKSPINGYVRLVEVNMGMYIQPEQEMFEIVDNDHIHIDLMVYEKDIDKVREGQKVLFSLTTRKEEVFEGKIFAIGKAFENEPKAVSVHAEIANKTGNLLPGMYVDGRIETDLHKVKALPDEAVVMDGGLSYVFVKEKGRGSVAGHDSHEGHDHGSESDDQIGEEHAHEGHDHGSGKREEKESGHGHDNKESHVDEYIFRKVEVNTGAKDLGFTEVVPAETIPENAVFVTQGAYYLLAELKKGEGGGGHHH